MRPLPPLPLRAADPRLEELAAAWVYTHPSDNTRRAYWADLAAFAAFCAGRGGGVLEAERDDVEAFKAEVEGSGASAATVARRLAALASFYRYAETADTPVGDGQGPSRRPGAPPADRMPSVPPIANPMAAVARPSVPAASATDLLSKPQQDALWEAAITLGHRTGALVGLLLLDGLKLGEAVAADADHLTARGPALTLRLAGRDVDRPDIELHQDTARTVLAYLDGRREGPLLLAQAIEGRPPRRLTRFGANYLVKRAVEQAGLPLTVSANTLRRTYVAAALDGGSPVRTVQRRVGHADARTTERLRRV